MTEDEMIDRVRQYLINWDDTPIPDGASPRIIPNCAMLRVLLRRIDDATIQGLKDTIERLSVLHDQKDQKIKELEKQVSKLGNELSWANEPFCY